MILSTTTTSDIDGYEAGWVGIYECRNGGWHSSYTELGQFINYAKIDAVLDLLSTGTSQVYVEYNWQGSACQIGLQVLALSPAHQ